ncbi:MAG: nitronate monooxygenase [Proteobacteria bacterium]|nr:nitronate monooxygenase [Pseudomonadota bacterium]
MTLPSLACPIVLAPMAGGPNTPALAAAVANAGGIGSFGFAYQSPERIAEDLAAARRLTGGALNANFFVFRPVEAPAPDVAARALATVAALPGAADVTLAVPAPPYYPDLTAQLEPVWRLRPEVLTFHFGLPPSGVIARARALGISVGITATRASEARAIAAAGADFVVAQGREAGGHCGVFTAGDPGEWLPVRELVRAVRAVTDLPVVAAGGLMTGADIRAVLSAGAEAAQLGTAFLATTESGASAAHRRYLMTERARGTVLTRGFSGRYARGIRNAFTDRVAGADVLPFPLQNTLTAPLRRAAGARDDGEYQSLWAGERYALCRGGGARELVRELLAELDAA